MRDGPQIWPSPFFFFNKKVKCGKYLFDMSPFIDSVDKCGLLKESTPVFADSLGQDVVDVASCLFTMMQHWQDWSSHFGITRCTVLVISRNADLKFFAECDTTPLIICLPLRHRTTLSATLCFTLLLAIYWWKTWQPIVQPMQVVETWCCKECYSCLWKAGAEVMLGSCHYDNPLSWVAETFITRGSPHVTY